MEPMDRRSRSPLPCPPQRKRSSVACWSFPFRRRARFALLESTSGPGRRVHAMGPSWWISNIDGWSTSCWSVQWKRVQLGSKNIPKSSSSGLLKRGHCAYRRGKLPQRLSSIRAGTASLPPTLAQHSSCSRSLLTLLEQEVERWVPYSSSTL